MLPGKPGRRVKSSGHHLFANVISGSNGSKSSDSVQQRLVWWDAEGPPAGSCLYFHDLRVLYISNWEKKKG